MWHWSMYWNVTFGIPFISGIVNLKLTKDWIILFTLVEDSFAFIFKCFHFHPLHLRFFSKWFYHLSSWMTWLKTNVYIGRAKLGSTAGSMDIKWVCTLFAIQRISQIIKSIQLNPNCLIKKNGSLIFFIL